MRDAEAAKALTQTNGADCANLIDCNLSFAAGTYHLNPASPTRMDLRGQRAHYDRIEMPIHFIATHDDDRSCLHDLAAPRRFEVRQVDRVTLRWRQLPDVLVEPVGSCGFQVAPVFLFKRHFLESVLPRQALVILAS